jgi:uncharacterized protein YegL
MNALQDFTVSEARPLPLIILADTSGSMIENGNIDALNTALNDMADSFKHDDDGHAEIHVSVITFGGKAKIHQALTPASEWRPEPLKASGRTPMDGAFDLAREMIEDKGQVPGRAYKPVIVLASDAKTNDGTPWEESLEKLLTSDRAGKAQRFSVGIGADADATPLRKFVSNGTKVYVASEASQIKKFFQYVTMSTTARSRQPQPNNTDYSFPEPDLDELL